MTTTPTGPRATGGSRFSIGGQVADLGYATGWRVVRAMRWSAANGLKMFRAAPAATTSRSGTQIRRNAWAREGAYLSLTLSCVRCHQYVARARVARIIVLVTPRWDLAHR